MPEARSDASSGTTGARRHGVRCSPTRLLPVGGAAAAAPTAGSLAVTFGGVSGERFAIMRCLWSLIVCFGAREVADDVGMNAGGAEKRRSGTGRAGGR